MNALAYLVERLTSGGSAATGDRFVVLTCVVAVGLYAFGVIA